MIQKENLDVRAVTMGITLLDCHRVDVKSTCQGPYTRSAHKKSEGMGTTVKYGFCKNRYQYGIGHSHQAHQSKQEYDIPDRSKTKGIREPFFEAPKNISILNLCFPGGNGHHEQENDNENITDSVYEETDPFTR